MSKLIVNTGTLSAGGAERVLSILSYSFADAFDEVYYVMWLDDKYPDIFYKIDPRVKIIPISKESGKNNIWGKILWFRRFVSRQRPSIVLSFMVMINFVVTISLIGLKIPQIVAERNDPRFFKGNKMLRKFIDFLYREKNIKGIFMQTQNNKDYFTSNCILNKTSVIPNPVLLDESNVGKGLNTKKEDLIVTVGRLTKQKRQEDLINAFYEFHKSHPSYKLCVWGEGERRFELEQMAESLNLKDYILFPGRTDNVIDEISKAKLFVLTSEYEGMSNALIEAMCCGIPCVSSRVSGSTDLIIDGVNGYLVDVGDVEGITQKMSLVVDNEVLSRKISKNAILVYNDLNNEVISKKWIDCILTKI